MEITIATQKMMNHSNVQSKKVPENEKKKDKIVLKNTDSLCDVIQGARKRTERSYLFSLIMYNDGLYYTRWGPA